MLEITSCPNKKKFLRDQLKNESEDVRKVLSKMSVPTRCSTNPQGMKYRNWLLKNQPYLELNPNVQGYLSSISKKLLDKVNSRPHPIFKTDKNILMSYQPAFKKLGLILSLPDAAPSNPATQTTKSTLLQIVNDGPSIIKPKLKALLPPEEQLSSVEIGLLRLRVGQELTLDALHQIQQKLQDMDKKPRIIRNQRPKTDLVTNEVFQRLVHVTAGQSHVAQRNRIAFTILYLTGMRVTELLQFKCADVEKLLYKGKIQAILHKTKKNHTVLISPEGKQLIKNFDLMQTFKLYANQIPKNGFFFYPQSKGSEPNDYYQALESKSFTTRLNNILHAIQGPDEYLTTHAFRRTRANRFLVGLKTSDELQSLMGWDSVQTARNYAGNHTKEQIEKMVEGERGIV